MSSPLDVREFLAGFLAEAEEHLRASGQNLLALDRSFAQGQSNARAVRELFRSLHTIKGLSAMVAADPIVDISHAMETVLRSADRAPGSLRREAVEPMLQALRAIEERVSALALGKPLAPAPASILDALSALQPEGGASGASAQTAISLPAELQAKVGAAEKQQLLEGVAAGKRALRADFIPSPERAAAGLTISSVRDRVSKLAEIVKVLPVSRPRSEEAPGGLAFVLLLLTDAQDEVIAEAAGLAQEALVPLVVESAQAPALPEEEEIPAEVQRRTVRVEVGRLDDALERLSALVVTRFRLSRALTRLSAAGADTREVTEIVAENGRQLRDLRAAIMRARMVPVNELLERLPLVVRGITRTSGKKVRVEIEGDGGAGFARDGRRPEGRSTGGELDKSVADRIFPALVHLVRNAVDHAIEMPEERLRLGKPEEAVIRVASFERSNRQLDLSVTDDGRGVDAEKLARKAGREMPANDAALLDLLTLRGLSSRDEATTTSGRGMGMDIVRRIAVDQLGGELLLRTSRGAGSTFTLRIPLSITIVDAFSFACGKQPFVVPVASIEEILEVDPGQLIRAPGGRELRLLQRRGETVPLLALDRILRLEEGSATRRKALIVRRNNEPFGFEVDRMLGQQEVVVRPLEDPLVHVPGVTGSTDLGDGLPTLVLDLLSLTSSLAQVRA